MWSTRAFARSDNDPQVTLINRKSHFGALPWHFQLIHRMILTTDLDFRGF
jgi:hypothetical protein